MSVFLVTNRFVDTFEGERNQQLEIDGVSTAHVRTGEAISNDGLEEALPVFRVASYDLAERRYELLPDRIVANYPALIRATHADGAARVGSLQMMRSLRERMAEPAADRAGDVLFFVHGFDYTLADALTEAHELHRRYVDPEDSPIAHLVIFSWPSRGEKLSYGSDSADAQRSGLLLARVFDRLCLFLRAQVELGEEPCRRRIHLAAHSMGAQVIEHFASALSPLERGQGAILSEVALLAADVGWDALELGRPLARLVDLCRRLTVYSNESDDALRVSAWTKHGARRLGLCGPRDMRRIPGRAVVVDTSDAECADGAPAMAEFADHWDHRWKAALIGDLTAVFSGQRSAKISGRERSGGGCWSLT